LAFAEGDWTRAARLLEPILAEIPCGGGSDEQRGVLSQSYLMSLIRCRERATARKLRTGWIGSRVPVPIEHYWLAQL